jgi:ectoine hydroxylase-related dioxygenase (phytanoyl-CoA dioxygenase family)
MAAAGMRSGVDGPDDAVLNRASGQPPAPRSDMADARADLADFGYCVVDRVLKPAELAGLRARLDEAAACQEAARSAWYSHGNQRVFMLLNRGEEFVWLAEHPVVLGLAEQVLGPDLLLSSITANITRPGNEAQQLHADQQYVQEPWLYPVTIQAVWMVDDFTRENGATRIVPGSHLRGRAPMGREQEIVHLLGEAGSVGFLDGRVWHGTDVNVTASQPRRGIFAYYCTPYLRQQENVFRSLQPEVRRKLSRRMRALLGYDVWYGLGTVDGIPRAWLGTGQRSGPTNADGAFDE